MPLEFLQPILEIATHHARVSYPVSPRRKIVFASYLSRIFITLSTLSILVAGIILLIEGYPLLSPISLISSTVLVLVQSLLSIYSGATRILHQKSSSTWESLLFWFQSQSFSQL